MKFIKILKKAFKIKDFLKANISFAQEGEDLILADLFQEQEKGFYVDVGAFDPVRFSNTKIFYDKGWNGINIEPNAQAMIKFKKQRPRDINLRFGVGSIERKMTYFCFDEPAVNTFCGKSARGSKEVGYKIIGAEEILVKPLVSLIPNQIIIDFMTIDCEGLDLEVLQSIDWEVCRPKIILIEIISDLDGIKKHPIYKYLRLLDYYLIAKTKRTCFFQNSKSLNKKKVRSQEPGIETAMFKMTVVALGDHKVCSFNGTINKIQTNSPLFPTKVILRINGEPLMVYSETQKEYIPLILDVMGMNQGISEYIIPSNSINNKLEIGDIIEIRMPGGDQACSGVVVNLLG